VVRCPVAAYRGIVGEVVEAIRLCGRIAPVPGPFGGWVCGEEYGDFVGVRLQRVPEGQNDEPKMFAPSELIPIAGPGAADDVTEERITEMHE